MMRMVIVSFPILILFRRGWQGGEWGSKDGTSVDEKGLNMDSKHESYSPLWLSAGKPIIEPASFAGPIGVGDALLCFSEDIFSRLVDAFGLGDGEEGPRFAGALKGKVGEDVALFQACFGGPAAGMLMEALVASGVERFVMAGQAGSISSRCRIGDLFLPIWGIREEGTSYHYLPEGVECRGSADLVEEIKSHLGTAEFIEGGIWTTDAPFRETMDKVQRYAEGGALAVEMECTALMAIAMYRDVDFAAALVITDELFRGEWSRGFGTPEVARQQDFLCQALASMYGL